MSERDHSAEWYKDARVFEAYRSGRDFVSPVFEPLVLSELVRQVSPGDVIFEIGAGSGYLKEKFGPTLPHSAWIEGDQNPDFLERDQPEKHIRLASQQPEIPLASSSVDKILRLCVIDNYDPDILSLFAAEANRVLKPGGRFINLLDLGPNPRAEILGAEPDLVPLPFFAPGSKPRLGLRFFDPNEIRGAKAYVGPFEVLDRYLDDPKRYANDVFSAESAYQLCDLLDSINLAKFTVNDWWKLCSERYSRALRQAGMAVRRDTVVERTDSIPREQLPNLPRSSIDVIRLWGVRRQTPAKLAYPQVKVTANLLVTVAQKKVR